MSRKYTEKAWAVLELAKKLSASMKHGYVGSEHLLLALCAEKSGVVALCTAGGEIYFGSIRADFFRYRLPCRRYSPLGVKAQNMQT